MVLLWIYVLWFCFLKFYCRKLFEINWHVIAKRLHMWMSVCLCAAPSIHVGAYIKGNCLCVQKQNRTIKFYDCMFCSLRLLVTFDCCSRRDTYALFVDFIFPSSLYFFLCLFFFLFLLSVLYFPLCDFHGWSSVHSADSTDGN